MITVSNKEGGFQMTYTALSKWLLRGWAMTGLLFMIHLAIPYLETYFG